MTRAVLAIDTATSRAVLALGDPSDGRLLAAADWSAGHSHAETILPNLDRLLAEAGLAVADLAGLVVGLGPGGFTGLRVGLATAKTLAHGLGRPLVGIGTAAALAEAAGPPRPSFVAMPAGPRDRYLVATAAAEASGEARLIGPAEFDAWMAATADVADALLAVDLDAAGIPAGSQARGRAALEGLGEALLRLGAAALASGRRDDVAALVPAYVTLPRGIADGAGEGTWSPVLR